MSFKDKPLKKIVADTRVTIDAIHTDIVKEFKSNGLSLIDKQKELGKLQKEEDEGDITAHLGSDWIAVVYLQLGYPSFGEFGMKFFSHIETGLESYVDGKQFNTQDKTHWKEYGKIPAKYNRLVLFRSNRWHSYGKGFGNDLNTSMLYQKMIING